MTHRINVYLEDQDLERLEIFSRARGWTKSHAIRVAIRALTHDAGRDPLLELSGDIDGLPANLSRNFRATL